MNLLHFIPGFRSGNKVKMALVSLFYYLPAIFSLVTDFWGGIMMLSLPFIFVYGYEYFKHRREMSPDSRKAISMIVAVSLLVFFASSSLSAALNEEDPQTTATVLQETQENKKEIEIKSDIEKIKLSEEPVVYEGTTMLPFRSFLDALGAKVVFDEATNLITGEKDGTKITMRLGDKNIDINGEKRTSAVAPMIIDGKTYIPARFVSDALGADLDWNATNKVATIKTDTSEVTTPVALSYANTAQGKQQAAEKAAAEQAAAQAAAQAEAAAKAAADQAAAEKAASEKAALAQQNTSSTGSGSVNNPYSNSKAPQGITYVGNANTKKFHISSCSSVNKMNPSNMVSLYSREEAVNYGYEPCQRCYP